MRPQSARDIALADIDNAARIARMPNDVNPLGRYPIEIDSLEWVPATRGEFDPSNV